MKKGSEKTMQQQQYEGFSYESEMAYGRQSVRDVWSEGEKLRPEPQRQKKKGRILPLAIIAVVIALLFVVFFLGSMVTPVSRSHAVHAVPAPIHKSYPMPTMPIKPKPGTIQKPNLMPIQNP